MTPPDHSVAHQCYQFACISHSFKPIIPSLKTLECSRSECTLSPWTMFKDCRSSKHKSSIVSQHVCSCNCYLAANVFRSIFSCLVVGFISSHFGLNKGFPSFAYADLYVPHLFVCLSFLSVLSVQNHVHSFAQ
jgi:hypothetical protein